jgi:uncharacterized protein YjbJ (UPF0337 family)
MKGAVKEKAGEWTNDPALETEGKADQAEGEAREAVGTVKRKAGEVADEVKKQVNR